MTPAGWPVSLFSSSSVYFTFYFFLCSAQNIRIPPKDESLPTRVCCSLWWCSLHLRLQVITSRWTTPHLHFWPRALLKSWLLLLLYHQSIPTGMTPREIQSLCPNWMHCFVLRTSCLSPQSPLSTQSVMPGSWGLPWALLYMHSWHRRISRLNLWNSLPLNPCVVPAFSGSLHLLSGLVILPASLPCSQHLCSPSSCCLKVSTPHIRWCHYFAGNSPIE